MPPRILGVTGLPCSGKSRAAAMIASGDVDGGTALLLKADDIGHEVLLRPEVAEALRGRFGADCGETGNPAAMRRAIAAKVFADPAALDWLERLVHPRVAEEASRRSASAGGRVVIEAALLFAAGMDRQCERVLVIEADFAHRLARANARGWDAEELRRREERLLPLFADAEKDKDSRTPARVDNNGSIEELRDALRSALSPDR